MALDLTMHDDTGYPKQSVPIRTDHYEDIMHFARCFHGYPLIRRMHDYYENAYYEPDEVEPLLRELDQFKADLIDRTNLAPDDPLFDTLQKMRALCEQAVREGRRLVAMAD